MEIILKVYFIIIMSTEANTQSYRQMNDLHERLFNTSRYNKQFRPLQNQSHVMQVNLTQYLISIDSFDISSGALQVYGYFEVSWNDELLTWDPTMYGGMKVISLQKQMIWKPEISLLSASDTGNDGSLLGDNGFASVWVDYQGFIVVVPAGSYKTRCDVDTTLFPFDRHKCTFQFYVSNHGLSELVLYSPSGTLGTRYFTKNGEWILEDEISEVMTVTGESTGAYSVSMLETSFHLRRRAAFDIINNYAPLMFMGILNSLTCFIRPDSGERLSFAVTLYLALTFTSTAIIEHFPNNSLKMPYFSYGMLTANIFNTLGVCWSIFIVRLASFQGDVCLAFPRLVRIVAVFNGKTNQSKTNIAVKLDTVKSLNNSAKRNDGNDVTEEDNTGDTKTDVRNDSDNREGAIADQITGLELANALDKTFFVSVLTVLVVFNIIFSLLVVFHRGT